MQGSEVRLEILKLVHRHDHSPEQIVARASELEKFVMGSSAEIRIEGKVSTEIPATLKPSKKDRER